MTRPEPGGTARGAGEDERVVSALADADERAVESALRPKQLSEFIERDPYVAGGLRFRHALIRDAAYEGLPFRRRRKLHQRVGEVYNLLQLQAGQANSQYVSFGCKVAVDTTTTKFAITAGEISFLLYSSIA